MKRFAILFLSLTCILDIHGKNAAGSKFAGSKSDSIAETVMKKTFGYPRDNGLYIGHAKSLVYTKFHINTDIHNVLLRIIPNTVHMDKGKNHYFGESMAMMEYSDIGVTNRRVIAFYSTLRKLKELRDVYMTNVSAQIYSPYLISDKLLSPFNETNRRYYLYRTDIAGKSLDSGKIWIAFVPRCENALLVNGKALVEKKTGMIDSVSFKAVYDNILHCNVGIKMGKNGVESLLSKDMDFDVRYKMAGNKICIRAQCRINPVWVDSKHYSDSLRRIRGKNKYNITRLNLLSPDTGNIIRNAGYFDGRRLLELNGEEDSLRQKALLIKRKAGLNSNDTEGKSIVGLSANALEDIFLDRHRITLFNNRATISIPPVLSLSMLQWSNSRGLAIQKRLNFTLQIDNGMSVSLKPKAGYSFKQKILYWELPLNLRLLPKSDGGFSVSMGNGNHIYSSLQAKEVREELKKFSNYDSLLYVFNKYNFNYYNDFYVRGLFYISPICGLNLKFGSVFHQRKPTRWKEEASLGGMRKYYKSFAPHIDVAYTPGMYYYEGARGKVPVYSGCPTFRGSYERGVNWFDCKNHYEKIEFDCSHRFDIGKLSSLYMRGGCGFFTNRKEMYFVDYDNFSFHDMPVGWNDDMTTEFHLLDRRFYNESNYYAMLGASYDTPMLFFGRLPWVSRAITRERIYLNAVSLHALNPYMEFGYGISTSFFDGALFVGAGNATGFEFGVKVSLRFFDKW